MSLASLAVLVACGAQSEEPAETGANGATSSAEVRLPVSLNEVMVALVNHAADPKCRQHD